MSDKIRVEVPGPPVSVEITWEEVRAYLTRKGWARDPDDRIDVECWGLRHDLVRVAAYPGEDEAWHLSDVVCRVARFEGREPADVLRDIAGLEAPRCRRCSEFGLRVKDGCLVFLWGEEEAEQATSREASLAAAREVLGTTAAEAMADEIEASAAARKDPITFADAVRFAAENRRSAGEARSADVAGNCRLSAMAWLVVAGRMLAREAAR